jgi:hypothetical protein
MPEDKSDKMPKTEGVKPIHDGYDYPHVETKPPARESLYDKVKKAFTTNTPNKDPQGGKAMADRKDQSNQLKGEY